MFTYMNGNHISDFDYVLIDILSLQDVKRLTFGSCCCCSMLQVWEGLMGQ